MANSHLWQIKDLPLIFVIKLLPKPAADQEPISPTNFHPFALTSCVGKILILWVGCNAMNSCGSMHQVDGAPEADHFVGKLYSVCKY